MNCALLRLARLKGKLIMNKLRGSRVRVALLAGLIMSASAIAGTPEVAGTFANEASAQTDRPHLIEGHYIVVVSDQPGKKNPRAAAALEALA
ncbi:MAG: hypothetical protein ACNA7M_15985, partial [Roseovarius sp.]